MVFRVAPLERPVKIASRPASKGNIPKKESSVVGYDLYKLLK
jgi:hypothetical protein